MVNSIKIAYHPETNRFVHVSNAANGLACKCICPECEERLEAVQGQVRTKHFRHHKNVNCRGAQETALHELGKQIIVEHSDMNIPGHGTITYSNPISERRLEKIRPDVTAIYMDEPIYFEIFVSHSVDLGKAKFLKIGKYKSLEIDLSKAKNAPYEEVKRLVLEETSNKKVFYWLPESQSVGQNPNGSLLTQLQKLLVRNWKLVLGFIGIILLFRYTFKRSR